MNDFFMSLGWDVKMIVAGFVGGVVHTFVFRQTSFYTAIGSIIAGIGTANYVARSVAELLHVSEGFAGFAVGLSAMAVCQGIVAAFKRFKLIQNGTTNDHDAN